MDGWLIALIVVALVVIVALIFLAIYSAPTTVNNNKIDLNQIRDKDNSQKQHTANLTIAFINLGNQTSNFLLQAKCGYRGVGETYDDMNKLANYIGHNLHVIDHGSAAAELATLLCQKNELYKELTEEVLVNKKIIKSNDHLLRQLNQKNVGIADIFHSVCKKNEKTQYITLLHSYDIMVVSQMGALTDSNHVKYLSSCREAQRLCLTMAMVLSYCNTKLT